MQHYGLLGKSLKHSFSQKYFTQKFATLGIDADYINLEVNDLSNIREFIFTKQINGFNVTIPYKQEIMQHLDFVHPDALSIGAVNVVNVIKIDNRMALIGYNTDVIGFRETLLPLLKPEHTKALILGNGGAARSVMYVLQQLHIENTLVTRNASENTMTYEQITPEIISEFKLIVNTTPVGQFPNDSECLPLPFEAFTAQHLVYDLIYNPPQTEFLKRAAAQGTTTLSGLPMLHRQADEAWNIFQSEQLHF